MKNISAKKIVYTSFLVDILDIVVNGIVMLITGSVVLLAESFEGAADLMATGLLLIGLKISKKRKNAKYPFGYGKALFLWTLISAIIILFFGAGLSIWFGLQRFLDPEKIEYIWLAYLALCISIVSNGYSFLQSSKRLLFEQESKQIFHIILNSVHVESKNTLVLDLTGTLAALFGLISLILYQLTGWMHFDGLGGMIIGTIIGFSAIVLIWGIKPFLIGKRAPLELEQQIEKIALKVEGISKITGLETMYIGSERLLVHLDVHMPQAQNIHEIEVILKTVRDRLTKAIPIIYSLQIEPKE